MTRLKVGDYVREVGGEAIGIVVHIMKDADLEETLPDDRAARVMR
jgi:hypothetical protein